MKKVYSFRAKSAGVIVALLFIVVIGLALLKLVSLAEEGGIGAWVDQRFEIQTESVPVAADNTIEIPVGGGVANYHSTETFHVVVAFFSDSNRVEYLSSECVPPIFCTDSNWRGYEFGPSAHQDARVTDKVLCITIPPSTNHLNLSLMVKLKYKVINSSKPFWFDNISGLGRGSCASNPAGSNISYAGGNGMCINYVKAIHPGGCAGTRGIGARGNNPFGNFPNPNTGSSPQGQSPQQSAGSTPGTGSGGGGSSSTTQSDNSNTVPSSSARGDQQQPEVGPSPFFDGKLFTAGSSTDDANTVSVGSYRIGYGWFYLLIGLAIAGVGGFYGWNWWRMRNHK